MTVVAVSNAGAARARRGVEALRAVLPAGAVHRVTESADSLLELAGHDRWQPDDVLIVNGGDGTVQHALTVLLNHCPAHRLPRIACLPGGTTNMTAYDLNGHRRMSACLATLQRALAPGAQVPPAPRPVVCVAHDTAARARFGLFFGIGTIVQGIEYFHARILPRGGGHELGAGAALTGTLWGIARGKPPFDAPLSVTVDGPLPGAPGRVTARLLFATTLERLFLGIRPYWGSGTGPLHATLVEARAPGFIRHMPRLLRGRPNAAMNEKNGYHSDRVDRLALTFQGAYTLDGELFANPGDTMVIAATEPVRFLPL